MPNPEGKLPDAFKKVLREIEAADYIEEALDEYIKTIRGLNSNIIRGLVVGAEIS